MNDGIAAGLRAQYFDAVSPEEALDVELSAIGGSALLAFFLCRFVLFQVGGNLLVDSADIDDADVERCSFQVVARQREVATRIVDFSAAPIDELELMPRACW